MAHERMINLNVGVVSGHPMPFDNEVLYADDAGREMEGILETLVMTDRFNFTAIGPTYALVQNPYGHMRLPLSDMRPGFAFRKVPIVHLSPPVGKDGAGDRPIAAQPDDIVDVRSRIFHLLDSGDRSQDEREFEAYWTRTRAELEVTRWKLDVLPSLLGLEKFDTLLLRGPVPIIAGAHYLARGNGVSVPLAV